MRNLILLSAIVCLSACVAPAPELERDFGKSVRAAVALQTLNPEAGGDAPVNGLEGRTAKDVYDRYGETFKSPPPPVNVFNIGVGIK